MPVDPFAWYDEYTNRVLPNGQPQQPLSGKPPPALPPLQPGEEDSLLSQLGSKALGGLGYAGSVLDKTFGGRAIRGVLGGHPRELASVLPLSDTLGITDPSEQVSGEQLLKNAGILEGEGQKGTFEARDLAGPALEIALNPATYLGLPFGSGAASKAGKVAGMIGEMPGGTVAKQTGSLAKILTKKPELIGAAETAAKAQGGTLGPNVLQRLQMHGPLPLDATGDLLHQPLGGLAGLGLPFSGGNQAVLGTGPTAQRIGGYLDQFGNWVKYSAPVRYARSLFDPSVMEATSKTGQQTNEAAFNAMHAGQAGVRERQLGALHTLQQGGQLDQGSALRQAMEGTFQGPQLPGDSIGAVTQQWNQRLPQMLDEAHSVGIASPALADEYAGYFPRYRTPLETDTRGYGGGYARQQLPTGHPSLEAREDVLRNIPGGTSAINEMLHDPEIQQAISQPTAAQVIRSKYGLVDDAELGALQQANIPIASTKDIGDIRYRQSLTPAKLQTKGLAPVTQDELDSIHHAELAGKFKQSEDLSKWALSQDPQYFAGGDPEKQLDFFGNHPVTDMATRETYHNKVMGSANAIHDMLVSSAQTGGPPAPGSVPLLQVLKDAGLDFEIAGANKGGLTTQLQKLQGANILGPNATLSDLQNVHIPGDVARDATRYTRSMTSPAGLEPFLKVYDAITNATKAGQTAMFPFAIPTQARNGIAGMFLNWVEHAHDPNVPGGALNPWAYVKPYINGNTIRTGGTMEGASAIPSLAHLGSDEAASQALRDLAFKHNLLEPGLFQEVIGQGEHAAQKGVPLLPGEGVPGIGEMMSNAVPRTWAQADPRGIAGLDLNSLGLGGSTNVDQFAPVKAGRQLAQATHENNVMAGFIAKMQQGYTPEVAAAQTKAAQYSTDVLTPFERSVMRRVIPYYSWMRHVIPYTLEQMAANPGGRMATATMLGGKAGQQTGFIPDWLKSGVAVPLGTEEDGQQRYLTHLGLPPEDVFGDLSFGPGGLKKTAMAVAGMSNPLIKAPLEQLTGTQFYSGRNLSDLRPDLTGNQLGDQLLMNSPLSRAATTIRTAVDQRKGIGAKALNLGTGLRVSDVDMSKARDIGARDMLEELLHSPNIHQYTDISVRPEDLQNLSPEQIQLLRLNKTLEQQAQQKAKQTKQIGIQQGRSQ